jgi:hypothetical protein
MAQLEKYPLDFAALEKGSWLEGNALVRAVGTTPEHTIKWRLGLLSLQQKIEAQTNILCCENHDRIRLMTDVESREHTQRGWLRHYRGLKHQVFRRSRVDLSMIPSTEQQEMESETRVMVGVTLATRAELKRQKRLELLSGRKKKKK